MKTCSKCQTTKPFEAFSKKTANKDGYAYRCKACRAAMRNKSTTTPLVMKAPKPAHQPKAPLPTYAPQPKPTLSTTGVCHQKVRRDATEAEDRSEGYRFDLTTKDFSLAYERLTPEHSRFIERYEWLGKIGWAVKWCFTARFEGHLAGVVLMSEPTMATKYKDVEALIQRGAASSWAPKNLNSMLVMFACRWMVQNTHKRLFTCYSDPSAGEIGTIYQACNFMYLGRGWGVKAGVLLPNGKLVSKREFTKTSAVKRWAKELGIQWRPEWCKANGYQDIASIPVEVKEKLLARAELEIAKYPVGKQESKGKYALILGRDKREERELKKTILFKSYPYPKRDPSAI